MPTPTSTSPPLISIVTPCHNAVEFVGETIESVLAQTDSNRELIVVDDGSTDGSWEVISSYAGRITPVRLRDNRGASHARNRGAELARGEYLMFLDADDVLAPGTLACLLAAISGRTDSIAVCRWKRLRRSGEGWFPAPADVPLPRPDADPLGEWLEDRWVPPCAVLWEREVYDRVGGWDEALSYNDDGDLMMRAFLHGARIIVAECGESYYRFHGGERVSVGTDLFSASKLESGMRVFEKLSDQLAHRGSLASYRIRIGAAYLKLAMLGYQHGHREIARECLRRGERYAGRMQVSATWVGRVLERVFGLERKEAIAAALGRWRVLTGRRRVVFQRKSSHDAGSGTLRASGESSSSGEEREG